MELRFLFSAHCLLMLYISTKLHENISKGFKVIKRTQCPYEIFKGEQFSKNVGGVMVFNLCTLSDNALYLYQVL